jgi:hypothetical protein
MIIINIHFSSLQTFLIRAISCRGQTEAAANTQGIRLQHEHARVQVLALFHPLNQQHLNLLYQYWPTHERSRLLVTIRHGSNKFNAVFNMILIYRNKACGVVGFYFVVTGGLKK